MDAHSLSRRYFNFDAFDYGRFLDLFVRPAFLPQSPARITWAALSVADPSEEVSSTFEVVSKYARAHGKVDKDVMDGGSISQGEVDPHVGAGAVVALMLFKETETRNRTFVKHTVFARSALDLRALFMARNGCVTTSVHLGPWIVPGLPKELSIVRAGFFSIDVDIRGGSHDFMLPPECRKNSASAHPIGLCQRCWVPSVHAMRLLVRALLWNVFPQLRSNQEIVSVPDRPCYVFSYQFTVEEMPRHILVTYSGCKGFHVRVMLPGWPTNGRFLPRELRRVATSECQSNREDPACDPLDGGTSYKYAHTEECFQRAVSQDALRPQRSFAWKLARDLCLRDNGVLANVLSNGDCDHLFFRNHYLERVFVEWSCCQLGVLKKDSPTYKEIRMALLQRIGLVCGRESTIGTVLKMYLTRETMQAADEPVEQWNAIKSALRKCQAKAPSGHWDHVVYRIAAFYAWPRIDFQVSQPSHFMRAPFTPHAKTGSLVAPVNIVEAHQVQVADLPRADWSAERLAPYWDLAEQCCGISDQLPNPNDEFYHHLTKIEAERRGPFDPISKPRGEGGILALQV